MGRTMGRPLSCECARSPGEGGRCPGGPTGPSILRFPVSARLSLKSAQREKLKPHVPRVLSDAKRVGVYKDGSGPTMFWDNKKTRFFLTLKQILQILAKTNPLVIRPIPLSH